MTKRDMVNRIARQSDLTQHEVMEIVQQCFDLITSELAAGRGVEFRNFGVFDLAVRKPRVGRNPNAPQNTVDIPERVVVRFKPGKTMAEKVSELRPKDVQDS